MSALQVEFTQNSVGIKAFSQNFLDSLFHFVRGVTCEFWMKVLRSKVEPNDLGVGASQNAHAAKTAPLKPDMVPTSRQTSSHENHRFEPIRILRLNHRTSCMNMQPKHIHINERQQAAGPRAFANAVSTRERHCAMRGVSYVGHRTNYTASTTGRYADCNVSLTGIYPTGRDASSSFPASPTTNRGFSSGACVNFACR